MAPSRTLLDTSCVPKPAQASWSAVALHRFLKLRVSASPAVKLGHPASWCYKSARGLAHSRTLPRYSLRAQTRASILECGGPPPLSSTFVFLLLSWCDRGHSSVHGETGDTVAACAHSSVGRTRYIFHNCCNLCQSSSLSDRQTLGGTESRPVDRCRSIWLAI